MDSVTPPDIVISEAVLNVLRGLRLANDPAIGEAAAKREQQEMHQLNQLRSRHGASKPERLAA